MTTQPPRISVCIANYKGEMDLPDCLDSVLAQRGDFHLEVLVHDDASPDGSLALLRSRYPGVRVIESARNVGFCISNNRMAEVAQGDYLLLLNNDARLRLGSLAALLSAAQTGHAQDILGLPQHTLVDGSLVDRGYRTDPWLNPIPILEAGTHEAGVATGACLWTPRAVWTAIGGFPPWFESIAEDIYLCQAARLLGHRVLVLDAPGFDHWIGKNLGGGKLAEGRMQTTTRRRALSERNKTAVMLICYPLPALLVLLPLHALALAAEAVFLLFSGTGRAKVRAIYAPILPWLWRHRRDISTERRRLRAAGIVGAQQFFSQTTWMPHKLRMLWRHGTPQIR